MSYYGWKPYVPVAARRAKAMRELEKLRKKGHTAFPVAIEGLTIARTFWGKAWCDNLERYSDFANRLPRGRTYVRNGSVVDLQIAPGEVTALVSGSEIYRVAVKVSSVSKKRYEALSADCAGAIDSLVELLQGRFSKAVMERICREETGLFPAPKEIEFSCSCPDWAYMCKHVAAVLYGIGARLDARPELLFTLRQVDENDLIAKAGEGLALPSAEPTGDKVLAGEDLSVLFGLDMGDAASVEKQAAVKATKPRRAMISIQKQPERTRKATGKGAPKVKAKTEAAAAGKAAPRARGMEVPKAKNNKQSKTKDTVAQKPGKSAAKKAREKAAPKTKERSKRPDGKTNTASKTRKKLLEKKQGAEKK
jgi:uncharacterized Zn finger protein